MKSIRQLLRQPLKTLSGIVLVTLAVAVLCVCVGQAVAASATQEEINNTFHTLAFPTHDLNFGTDSVNYNDFPDEEAFNEYYRNRAKYVAEKWEEVRQWMEALPETHPELVQSISSPGLASAYIPQLEQDNYTNYDLYVDMRYGSKYSGDAIGDPYSQAMLEITLDSVEEPMKYTSTPNEPVIYTVNCRQSDGSVAEETKEYIIQLTGTVNRVIGLEAGYEDPTGWMATLTLHLPNEESWKALNLTIGQRYLVYGTNFVNWDWQYRQALRGEQGIYLKELKWENLHYYSDAVIAANRYHHPEGYDVAYYYDEEGHYWLFTNRSIRYYKGIAMDLEDKSLRNAFTVIPGSDNLYQRTKECSFTDETGEAVTMPFAEYREKYRNPVIAHLRAPPRSSSPLRKARCGRKRWTI